MGVPQTPIPGMGRITFALQLLVLIRYRWREGAPRGVGSESAGSLGYYQPLSVRTFEVTLTVGKGLRVHALVPHESGGEAWQKT